MTNTQELQKVKYGSFPEIFSKFRSMAEDYNVPFQSLISAFGFQGGMFASPQVMNQRFQGIGTSPISFNKDEIAEMLKRPQTNER